MTSSIALSLWILRNLLIGATEVFVSLLALDIELLGLKSKHDYSLYTHFNGRLGRPLIYSQITVLLLE